MKLFPGTFEITSENALLSASSFTPAAMSRNLRMARQRGEGAGGEEGDVLLEFDFSILVRIDLVDDRIDSFLFTDVSAIPQIA